MPIQLNTLARDVDIAAPGTADMLRNLQANILRPHGRDHARHVFLRFTGSPDQVKTWIRTSVVPLLTSSEQQYNNPAGTDGGMVGTFHLSATGYKHLGFSLNGFASVMFRRGMKDRTDGLLDAILDVHNKDPKPDKWEAPFQKTVHAMVALADDKEAVVEAATLSLEQSAGGIVEVLGIEKGNTLRRFNKVTGKNDPVEHFGYFDGISQPFFTQRDLAKRAKEEPDTDIWDPEARLSLVLVDDPLTNEADAFGSYLVYRKLGQDVAQFDRSVASLAAALDIAAELAGAMVVGRFKDGTPVLKADVAGLGAVNNFEFGEDRAAFRCPFHSHIRKVNPRGTTPATSLEGERKRRIARRGIPYGKPLPNVADNMETTEDATEERGLLFMCYQSNIEDQFEFIQRAWCDNEHFPTAVATLGALHQRDTGDDPLIGQDRDEGQRWPKEWGNTKAGKKTFNFEAAVRLKGGEYFFSPSFPFLRSL